MDEIFETLHDSLERNPKLKVELMADYNRILRLRPSLMGVPGARFDVDYFKDLKEAHP